MVKNRWGISAEVASAAMVGVAALCSRAAVRLSQVEKLELG